MLVAGTPHDQKLSKRRL